MLGAGADPRHDQLKQILYVMILCCHFCGVTGVTGVTVSNGAGRSRHPLALCRGDRGDSVLVCHLCRPRCCCRGAGCQSRFSRPSPLSPVSPAEHGNAQLAIVLQTVRVDEVQANSAVAWKAYHRLVLADIALGYCSYAIQSTHNA